MGIIQFFLFISLHAWKNLHVYVRGESGRRYCLCCGIHLLRRTVPNNSQVMCNNLTAYVLRKLQKYKRTNRFLSACLSKIRRDYAERGLRRRRLEETRRRHSSPVMCFEFAFLWMNTHRILEKIRVPAVKPFKDDQSMICLSVLPSSVGRSVCPTKPLFFCSSVCPSFNQQVNQAISLSVSQAIVNRGDWL